MGQQQEFSDDFIAGIENKLAKNKFLTQVQLDILRDIDERTEELVPQEEKEVIESVIEELESRLRCGDYDK